VYIAATTLGYSYTSPPPTNTTLVICRAFPLRQLVNFSATLYCRLAGCFRASAVAVVVAVATVAPMSLICRRS